jgi:hypothetical protein
MDEEMSTSYQVFGEWMDVNLTLTEASGIQQSIILTAFLTND